MKDDNIAEIVKETVENLKGMSYSTTMEVLRHIQREIEHNLTLN